LKSLLNTKGIEKNKFSWFLVLYIDLSLRRFMNDNSKVVIKVEYERDGMRRSCYGEIDEQKLENFYEEENFLLMENDGETLWIDVQSITSVDVLEVMTRLHGKMPIGSTCQEQDAST